MVNAEKVLQSRGGRHKRFASRKASVDDAGTVCDAAATATCACQEALYHHDDAADESLRGQFTNGQPDYGQSGKLRQRQLRIAPFRWRISQLSETALVSKDETKVLLQKTTSLNECLKCFFRFYSFSFWIDLVIVMFDIRAFFDFSFCTHFSLF